MPQAISILNIFPTYATREDYTARTGKPCPAWNSTRKPKSWEDSSAVQATEDMMVYDRIFLGMDGAGNPKWKRLFLVPGEAAIVNIPPTGPGMTNVPGADQPVIACPMRELAEDEIIKAGFGNLPVLWKASEIATQEIGWTAAEKELLLAAARRILAG